jgi:hypothetical protein
MTATIEQNVKDFYGKLLHCEANSGKMRWNAVCEDLVSIYEAKFTKSHQKIDSIELLNLLFEPDIRQEIKKKKLIKLFEDDVYSNFFMNILYVGLDDPKAWTEWVSHYRY